MLNMFNSVPVVGYVKGVLHYTVGDTENGNKAMRECTRSTVVMGAGAAGLAAGPVGAAVLGAAAGAAWDAGESAVTGEGQGLVANMENIVNTAMKGQVPLEEIVHTGLTIGGDVIGGLGGGTIAKSSVSLASKSLVKETVKTVVRDETVLLLTSYGVTRNFVQESEKFLRTSTSDAPAEPPSDPPRGPSRGPSRGQQSGSPSNSSHQQSSRTSSTTNNQPASSNTSGGGDRPPRRNPRNTSATSQQESYWQAFLDIFGEQSLDQINIRGKYIFRNLTYQKTYLKNLIIALKRRGLLRRVVVTIRNIFNAVDLNDVTYVNFVSLAEFIMQYLNEQMVRLNERNRMRQDSPDTYEERRDEIVRIACTEILQHDYTILRVFQRLQNLIELHHLPVDFRNIFAAIYHYYKHRVVGSTELTVQQYYNIIQSNLDIIMQTEQYENLGATGNDLRFERYYECYGTRLVIIIKKHGQVVVLSTCFFMDFYEGNDLDGDTYINGEWFNFPQNL